MEEKYYYTEDEINEIIEYLRELLYEMFLKPEQESPEAMPESPEQVDVQWFNGHWNRLYSDGTDSGNENFDLKHRDHRQLEL